MRERHTKLASIRPLFTALAALPGDTFKGARHFKAGLPVVYHKSGVIRRNLVFLHLIYAF